MGTITEDMVLTGALQINGRTTFSGSTAGVVRSDMTQEDSTVHDIPWVGWRVFDALHTNLPGTSAADDLGLIGGTIGTGSPTIQTSDLKAAGATSRKARCTFRIPNEYTAGQTVIFRLHAGMKTTVSDGTATIDVSAYESDKEEGAGSDLVTTAATTINSLTMASKDFTVTSSGLAAGDELDILVTIAINDSSTGTAVIGIIGSVSMLLDTKG